MASIKIASVSYCLLATVFVVCGKDAHSSQWNLENDPRFDARVSDILAKNVLQLSQEIGTMILQDSDKPTEVFSPLSIYTALCILLMGANGQTFQELSRLLKINNGKFEMIFYSLHAYKLDLRVILKR